MAATPRWIGGLRNWPNRASRPSPPARNRCRPPAAPSCSRWRAERGMPFDRRSAGVTAAGLATFLNLYVTQALMPPLATTFDVSTARTGITVTAPLLAVALVAPFVG